MKRTCNGCKALNLFPYISCGLGHKVKQINLQNAKPLEKCEKPTTIKKYVELMLRKKMKFPKIEIHINRDFALLRIYNLKGYMKVLIRFWGKPSPELWICEKSRIETWKHYFGL